MKKFEYNFDIYNKFKFNFEKCNFSRLNSFEFESIRITTLKLLQTRIMTAQNKEEFNLIVNVPGRSLKMSSRMSDNYFKLVENPEKVFPI